MSKLKNLLDWRLGGILIIGTALIIYDSDLSETSRNISLAIAYPLFMLILYQGTRASYNQFLDNKSEYSDDMVAYVGCISILIKAVALVALLAYIFGIVAYLF